jgi:hypothetical protein
MEKKLNIARVYRPIQATNKLLILLQVSVNYLYIF